MSISRLAKIRVLKVAPGVQKSAPVYSSNFQLSEPEIKDGGKSNYSVGPSVCQFVCPLLNQRGIDGSSENEII